MANALRTEPTNVVREFYSDVTPKKALTILVGMVTFLVHQHLRRNAYRQSYGHLDPSAERLTLVATSGLALGLEAAFVALVASVLVYGLIDCINRRARLHQA